jgi:hypothetical protein
MLRFNSKISHGGKWLTLSWLPTGKDIAHQWKINRDLRG